MKAKQKGQKGGKQIKEKGCTAKRGSEHFTLLFYFVIAEERESRF